MDVTEEDTDHEMEEEEVTFDISRLEVTNMANDDVINIEFVNILKIGRSVTIGQKLGGIEGLFNNRVMSRNHATIQSR